MRGVDWDILSFSLILLCKVMFTDWIINGDITQGSFLTSLGIVLILSSISYLINLRWRKVTLFSINLLISSVLLTDLIYFSYFNEPISVHIFYQFTNVSGLGPSVLSLLEWKYLLLFLDILFIRFIYRRRLPYYTPLVNIKRFSILFLVAFLVLSLVPIKNVSSDNTIVSEESDSYVEEWGPLGHHVLDTYYYIKDGIEVELSPEDEEEIQSWFSARTDEKNRSEAQKYEGIGEGKNLILIQMESLQNFVMNREINGQEITPNLNRLLKNSIYFSNFYPQTAEGNSSDAELLMNTSLYPIKQGSTFFRFPENDYRSLGELLQEKGYTSLAIHADEGDYWNRDKVYPNIGIDTYKDIESFEIDEEIGMGLSDGSMFRQSITMLEEQKAPFYALMITLTSHIPFILPEEHQYLTLPQEMNDSLMGHYLQSVRYTDEQIGNFMNQLKNSGLLDNSIIVFYGDHAGIHKKDKQQIETFIEESALTNEEWLRKYATVPFMIYHPSIEGDVITTVGGQIDGLPTIGYIMGLDEEKWANTAFGQNLLTATKGSAIIPSGDYADRAFITDKEVRFTLEPEQEKILDLSDLIIRSDYFRKMNR